jgi:hypothetical protein
MMLGSAVMQKFQKILFSITFGLVLALGSQSVFALSEAVRAAAAAAAEAAKSADSNGQPAANQIAEAGFNAADKDEEDLASALACLVLEESDSKEISGVPPEVAAKAAAEATGAPPGTVITVCDGGLAYTVTSSPGLGAGVAVAALLIGGGAAAGGGGDNVPTSP